MSRHDNSAPSPGSHPGPESGSKPGSERGPEAGANTVDADTDLSSGSSPTPESARRALRRGVRGRASRALITDAAFTPEQNRQSRERQYAILQGLRLPFILLALVAVWANLWVLAGILFVVSVPLPWIAVVRGNARGEVRDTRQKNVYKPAAARQQMLSQQQHSAIEPGAGAGAAPAIIDHDE